MFRDKGIIMKFQKVIYKRPALRYPLLGADIWFFWVWNIILLSDFHLQLRVSGLWMTELDLSPSPVYPPGIVNILCF